MIVTIASFKGGVGKTTTAVHLAAYLANQSTTLLIDGDLNRSATRWAERGGLPFQVIDERKAAKYARSADHIVIDTQARPEQEDLEALADGCDRLIIPCTPDALALDAMMLTVNALHQLGSEKYRILLTIIPPKPSKDGEEAKKMLSKAGLPILESGIRRYTAFRKAALEGTIVSEITDKKARIAWNDYQDLGKEVLS